MFTIIHKYTKRNSNEMFKWKSENGGWRRLGNEASAVHVSSTSSSVVPANRITQTDTPVTGKVLLQWLVLGV